MQPGGSETFSTRTRDGRYVSRTLPYGATDEQIRAAFGDTGWQAQQAVQRPSVARPEAKRPQVADHPFQIEPYKQSFGEWLESKFADGLDFFGGDSRNNRRVARKAFNFTNDLTPVGNVTLGDEGAGIAKRALTRGDLGQFGLGVGLTVLAAAPIPGAIKRRVTKGMFGADNLRALLKDERGTFAGRGAKTADLDALKKAEALEAQGLDRGQIWNRTGWFRGRDDKWRFEIDDSDSFLESPAGAPRGYERLQHDDLQAAYPQVREVQQSIRRGDKMTGRFDESPATVHAEGLVPQDRRSVANHEFQHFVQGREGFAQGGNPDLSASMLIDSHQPRVRAAQDALRAREAELPFHIRREDDPRWRTLNDEYARLLGQRGEVASSRNAYDHYRRLAGEVEARNVQTRLDMTPEQRRATPPWETEDVAWDDQIVRFDR